MLIVYIKLRAFVFVEKNGNGKTFHEYDGTYKMNTCIETETVNRLMKQLAFLICRLLYRGRQLGITFVKPICLPVCHFNFLLYLKYSNKKLEINF